MAGEIGGADRAYAEIKRQILDGELRLRERLDLEALARSLKLSITPIRSALTRLSGERLITARGSRGYFVTMWTEAELKALYEWRGALALLALGSWKGAPEATSGAVTLGYDKALLGMLNVMILGANPELARAATNANERLSAAIAVEADVLPHASEDLRLLAGAIAAKDKAALAAVLKRLFAERADQAVAIRTRAAMRALPSNGG